MANCIICNSNKYTKDTSGKNPDFGDEFDVVSCSKCSLLKTNTRDSDLSRYYEKNVYFAKDSSTFNKIKKAFGILTKVMPLEKFKRSGRMLDVGSGDGKVLEIFDNRKWDLYGIEPYGKTKLKKENIHIYRLKPEKTKFENKFFDVITFWHVLEHIENPIEVLKECKRILKDDGILFISIPNSESIGFKVFKESWFALYLPVHLYHYNIRTISKLLEKTGFRIIKVNKFPVEYTIFVVIQSVYNLFKFFPQNYLYKAIRGRSGSYLYTFGTILLAPLVLLIAIPVLILEYFDNNGSGVINVFAEKI